MNEEPSTIRLERKSVKSNAQRCGKDFGNERESDRITTEKEINQGTGIENEVLIETEVQHAAEIITATEIGQGGAKIGKVGNAAIVAVVVGLGAGAAAEAVAKVEVEVVAGVRRKAREACQTEAAVLAAEENRRTKKNTEKITKAKLKRVPTMSSLTTKRMESPFWKKTSLSFGRVFRR